jgi:hypothetical protein
LMTRAFRILQKLSLTVASFSWGVKTIYHNESGRNNLRQQGAPA